MVENHCSKQINKASCHLAHPSAKSRSWAMKDSLGYLREGVPLTNKSQIFPFPLQFPPYVNFHACHWFENGYLVSWQNVSGKRMCGWGSMFTWIKTGNFPLRCRTYSGTWYHTSSLLMLTQMKTEQEFKRVLNRNNNLYDYSLKPSSVLNCCHFILGVLQIDNPLDLNYDAFAAELSGLAYKSKSSEKGVEEGKRATALEKKVAGGSLLSQHWTCILALPPDRT